MYLLPISVIANFLFFSFFFFLLNTRGVFTLVTNTRVRETRVSSACAQPVNGEINPLMRPYTRYTRTRTEVYSSITKVQHAQMHSIDLKRVRELVNEFDLLSFDNE